MIASAADAAAGSEIRKAGSEKAAADDGSPRQIVFSNGYSLNGKMSDLK